MAQGSITRHIAADKSVAWWVRTEERDPVTGKRKRPRHVFPTKREAEAFLSRLHADIERRIAVDASKMTVKEHLNHWLETCAKPSIRPSTYASYESLIRVRVLPALGAVPLQKLTVLHIQRLYSDLLAGTRADGKGGPLSNRTVRYVHAVLKMALKQATRWRLVARNVAEDADAPRAIRPRVEAWYHHEARQFLATAQGDTYGAIWAVALHTGLRKGELLGLNWWTWT